jgi:hypothetical protein
MARIFPFRFHPIFEVTETPVGVLCPVCNEPIREGQLGFLIPCSAVVVDGKVRSLMAEGGRLGAALLDPLRASDRQRSANVSHLRRPDFSFQLG